MRSVIGWLLLVSLWSMPLQADEIRPAFLQITERQPELYQVLWKVPASSQRQMAGLTPVFDSSVAVADKPLGGLVGNAYLQSWMIQRPGGLAGVVITVAGLPEVATEVLLRIEYLDGTSLIHRLVPEAPSYTVEARAGLGQVVMTYFVLGVEHILIGVDHLLFVLVLLLLVNSTRKLVWTITAFTIAHSITLSLASLNLMHVPVPPVEACIALSILFVATEILRSHRGHPGLTERRPWLVAFSFGLLHGLGFAAALGEIGLPQTDIPAALLFFNVGVEIGQLLFVGVVLSCLQLVRRLRLPVPVLIKPATVYVIGILAAFWTVERTAAFWG
ncbi:HupE/UreJ family protein [Pseudomaricurvus sp. HS19]|nr:HupE/UreJ family protein [Pseudomaricurvus sp. HS19]